MSTAHAAPAAGRRVTLLTDFGTADGYVAAMKGVIAAIDPSVIIDDASHDIPPGDVNAAAWALGAYWRLYPPGT
ncbi:MAG: SAM-dependent chlorinase/fluorinase, partial [Longimicrobiales bacterium]